MENHYKSERAFAIKGLDGIRVNSVKSNEADCISFWLLDTNPEKYMKEHSLECVEVQLVEIKK
jgi:hypothetical protein